MFSAKRITPYIERFFGNVPITDSYEQRIADARKALAETDCVLIGAGAGLSTAAGLDYGGACFKREFTEFIIPHRFITSRPKKNDGHIGRSTSASPGSHLLP